MTINRHLLIIYISIFLSNTIFGQYNLKNPDIATKATIKYIDLIHLISNNPDMQDLKIGEVLGQVSPYPEKLSENFDTQINKSKELYNQQKYNKASKILNKALKMEPENPFILNEYARSLYRLDDKSDVCYDTYKNLIRILDSTYNNSDSILVIDVWFREAYWKLGVLHMDFGNWSDGFYEINRFLCSIQGEKGELVYEQALSYLTECAFEMGNYDLCLHFANRTLYYNPKNDYVKYYLEKMNNNN
jgi:tetratricopeptide (TPR) repeat protein